MVDGFSFFDFRNFEVQNLKMKKGKTPYTTAEVTDTSFFFFFLKKVKMIYQGESCILNLSVYMRELSR